MPLNNETNPTYINIWNLYTQYILFNTSCIKKQDNTQICHNSKLYTHIVHWTTNVWKGLKIVKSLVDKNNYKIAMWLSRSSAGFRETSPLFKEQRQKEVEIGFLGL